MAAPPPVISSARVEVELRRGDNAGFGVTIQLYTAPPSSAAPATADSAVSLPILAGISAGSEASERTELCIGQRVYAIGDVEVSSTTTAQDLAAALQAACAYCRVVCTGRVAVL